MRVTVPLLILFLGLAGCSRTRLEGKWKGQRAEGVAGDAQSAANAFATATEIEVKGNKITVTSPPGKEPQSGTFKVVRDEKPVLVISTEKDGADPQTFTFVDDKTVKWEILSGKTIVLAKQDAK